MQRGGFTLRGVDSHLERWIDASAHFLFQGWIHMQRGGFTLRGVDSHLERWIHT
jgi:hypothetical protein